MPPYYQAWNRLENARWLEQNDRALASAITSLPWVADGIDGAESEVVQNLLYIAVTSRPTVSSIVALAWVNDGVGELEAYAIAWINNFSNERVTASLVALDWIEDGIEDLEVQTIQELSYIDYDDSSVAASVVSLDWVQDGIDDLEFKAIVEFRYFDYDDAEITSSVVALGWVQDGIEAAEAEAIDLLNSFRDERVASSVVNLAWVQDGIEEMEVKTIQELSYIAYDSPEVALAVVALGWVQDGISALEFEAIDWLNNFGDAEAAAIVALGWVQDGIEELEVKAIQELSYIANDDPGVASSVVGLGWVQDGIEDIEWQAIDWVSNFNGGDVATSVVALAWMQDGVDDLEVNAIKELFYIDQDDSGVASSVVGLDWVRDRIEVLELEAIDWLSNYSNPVVTSSVVGLAWVRDGIEEVEVKAIEELSYIDNYDVEVASSVVGLDWMQEGVNEVELRTVEEIRRITRNDAGEASRIVAMPFLETLDPPDVSAVKALSQLASFRKDDFQRIISHSTLSDGITDDWAKIVATLYGVSKNNSDLVDTLLNPDRVTLEERVIELPLAGKTHLAIIRTAPGAERSMDLLEHAVRHSEEFMAVSFPTSYIGWLFGNAATPSFAGANFGTHIATLSKYDSADTDESEHTGSHIAHEVAHYYWSGNSNWVDEGASVFMASTSENARTGGPIEVTNDPCGYVRTIAELENLGVTSEAGADSAFICNYALGERLFVDLYRSLDEDSFREGLRDLYLLSQVEDEDEMQDNTEVGIEHVKAAFKDGGEVENPVVDVVAARWYDGTEPYDTSAQDTTPVNPSFRTVNGRIDVAYLAAAREGPPATTFSAQSVEDWARVFLDYSHSVGSNTEVPLEIVSYFEDGFVFNRNNVSFTAQPGFRGATWWLSVGVSPSKLWAPGQYSVYVYNEGRKLVDLEYEVTP